MTAFLRMGGYAQYLWPAYGIAFTVLILNIIWARRALARARAEARRRIAVRGELALQGGQA
ncbi:MAG TPA: heme exporter protein CcmD [Steroidobacteraceae bacterium]|nr:heme exporter protein CcmD [Steroidobacteraceae bacterium]